LQFLDPAGYAVFPVRNFKTRAAARLLKGKEVRVFSDALDGKRRVLMSKVCSVGNPNRTTGFLLWFRNHCISIPEPFVPRKRSIGVLLPGSMPRRHEPGLSAGRGNARGDNLHPTVSTLCGADLETGRAGIERTLMYLPKTGARTAMDDRGLYGNWLRGKSRGASSSRALPVKRFMDGLDHCKRGQKRCR